jgi:ribosomal protein L37AE/L43A
MTKTTVKTCPKCGEETNRLTVDGICTDCRNKAAGENGNDNDNSLYASEEYARWHFDEFGYLPDTY